MTTEHSEAQVEPPSLAQEAEVAKEFLEGLLASLELTGQVGSEELDEETVEVAVAGNDLGLLIGPKGQTLMAVQDLTRTVVQRGPPSSGLPQAWRTRSRKPGSPPPSSP
ncbi:MAG: KH domain-containing protein [Actinobacteria bacterium]|nr:MAG: KH domain-containing protein [Actinomycetota bacterium]